MMKFNKSVSYLLMTGVFSTSCASSALVQKAEVKKFNGESISKFSKIMALVPTAVFLFKISNNLLYNFTESYLYKYSYKYNEPIVDEQRILDKSIIVQKNQYVPHCWELFIEKPMQEKENIDMEKIKMENYDNEDLYKTIAGCKEEARKTVENQKKEIGSYDTVRRYSENSFDEYKDDFLSFFIHVFLNPFFCKSLIDPNSVSIEVVFLVVFLNVSLSCFFYFCVFYGIAKFVKYVEYKVGNMVRDTCLKKKREALLQCKKDFFESSWTSVAVVKDIVERLYAYICRFRSPCRMRLLHYLYMLFLDCKALEKKLKETLLFLKELSNNIKYVSEQECNKEILEELKKLAGNKSISFFSFLDKALDLLNKIKGYHEPNEPNIVVFGPNWRKGKTFDGEKIQIGKVTKVNEGEKGNKKKNLTKREKIEEAIRKIQNSKGITEIEGIRIRIEPYNNGIHVEKAQEQQQNLVENDNIINFNNVQEIDENNNFVDNNNSELDENSDIDYNEINPQDMVHDVYSEN